MPTPPFKVKALYEYNSGHEDDLPFPEGAVITVTAEEDADCKSPPPVAEKPQSFKDRIAAFNKAAATPITPFKPSGPPSGFIKKPFVPPPPSRDAYVPPPREAAPQKIYKRDEDPEISERQAQDQENAEKAGLVPAAADEEEDTPKPTSLKERIALLQKQQMEQATRQAEAAHKEKPKRPPKKRIESHEQDMQSENTEGGEADDAPKKRHSHHPSHHPKSPEARLQEREPFSDGNEADQSAAGETTEDAEGSSTTVEDDEEKPRGKAPQAVPRAHAAPTQEPEVGDEEDATEEEEEDEVDEETRRRMELRERMAKMSGGMGMPGMFGMPMPGMKPPPKKSTSGSERKSIDSHRESEQSPPPAQRIPMIPIPGMGMPQVRSPDSEDTEMAVEKENEPAHPITDEHDADEVPDVEDIKAQPQESGAPSPLPQDDDDYDPYRYGAPGSRAAPPPPSAPPAGTHEAPVPEEEDEDEIYQSPPPRRMSKMSQHHVPISSHQELPGQAENTYETPMSPPRSSMQASRKSLDAERTLGSRRSMDQSRPSIDHGHIANDVDLGQASQWWTQPNTPPPVFQNRKDVFFEIEESTTTKRGGKTIVQKDVYVLFQDYSQTVVTARFDAREPASVALEQRHEPSPQKLRQDQLEAAYEQFGRRISDGVNAKQNSTVGDGSPQALVLELLKPLSSALLPVGTRAYGALVYANLANASVQQNDEIRPGDIISLRNAKFEGKHGAMHAKYKMEVGKPDHVGVVVEWDGTKKKIRAFEQGRESKKVKVEGFRMADLRSGEVRVWRVMGRDWVGWDVPA
ncbi:assembly of actin patch protein [Neofusicoccum ribis]|uniref:Assembly of actin patch protein n=3 Tax=Neofusicoccum TaxID=407951 RepID=A0ABR3SBZ6_9PEZI